MNLYLISQSENGGYDTYDSAVVAAETENDARLINPAGADWRSTFGAWCKTPDAVTVELIGRANEGTTRGVILASFNAG